MAVQSVQDHFTPRRDLEQADETAKPNSPALNARPQMAGTVINQSPTVGTQEQNPELLQWRANVLLDEMMLGAVDIAADTASSARAIATPTPPPAATTNISSQPDPTYGVSGADEYDWPAQARAYAERDPYRDAASPTGGRASSPLDSYERPSVAPRQTSATPTTGGRAAAGRNGLPTQSPSPSNGTEQWLFAAEQRYQQLAARRQATTAAHEYDGWSAAPDYGVEAHETSARAVVPEYPAPTPAATTATGQAATVGGKGAPVRTKRSNLLPRMSNADLRTVQQEMGMLQSAIEDVLPAGHESRERALHLLQKAHAILQRDPNRSAEVDYYLQQVRTIVQRVQESAHWSELYRSRLRTYLGGWLILSAVVIIGTHLYQTPFLTWLSNLSQGGEQGPFAYNTFTILNAFFAGAMGGAVGVLLNMVNRKAAGQGFFDRKYGLRGLVLPLIGAGAGIILCLLFGVGYYLVGVEPANYLLLGILPALLAFAFGAAQEYVYGVRS